MKHYFIINPEAGPHDSTNRLVDILSEVFKSNPNDYVAYVSKSKEDTCNSARHFAANAREESIIYACGGDGTCYDVINSIIGYPNVHFGIIPIGSCNDFLKTFPKYNFNDFEKVIHGQLKPLDVGRVTCDGEINSYFLNEINIGFDARVNDDTNNSKYKAIDVKKAYSRAVGRNLIKFIRQPVKVSSDDRLIYEGKSLLLVCANGQYYGSKYHCAPFAQPDDGLLDFVLVKGVSRIKFLSLINGYKNGEHLTKKSYKRCVQYGQYNNITIESPKELVICLDGEIYHVSKVKVELLKHKIHMVFPNA